MAKHPARIGLELPPLDTTCPPDLTGYAAELWEKIVPPLADERLVTQADRGALIGYCLTCALYAAMCSEAQEYKPGSREHMQLSRQATKIIAALGRLSDLLPVTPLSRAKLQEVQECRARAAVRKGKVSSGPGGVAS